MLPQSDTAHLFARLAPAGRGARRYGPATLILVVMAMAAMPAVAQTNDRDPARASLKWMPRRPVAQASQEVIQTQAVEADSEPTIAAASQTVGQRTPGVATRVVAQPVAQPQVKTVAPTQPAAAAPAPAAAPAQPRRPVARSNGAVVVQPEAMQYSGGTMLPDEAMMPEGMAWDAGDVWGSCDGASGGTACGAGFMQWLCSPHPVYARSEMMVYWAKGMHAPPLVTTSPDGTARAEAGVLGQTGTSVLFGASNLTDEARLAGRWTLGRWFDACQTTGVEVSYMVAETDTTGYFATSTGAPILARPFYNVETGLQDSRLVAFPEVSNGSIDVYASTRLSGLDAVVRHGMFGDCNQRLDLVMGYRFMQLNDVFRTHEFTFSTDPTGVVPIDTTTSIVDSFETHNEFHGANLGFAGRVQRARWSMDMLMKLGVGNTHSRVALNGSTTTTTPGGTPVTSDAGLLVLPSNREAVSHDQFSMVPELGFNLGFDLTRRLRATFGYSLIYWSHVARAADQVNLDLNPAQFPPAEPSGPAIPRETFVVNDYWIQGLNLGLDFRF